MVWGRTRFDEQGGAGAAAGVLIVDDEPTVLRALRRILEPDGHRIRAATGPAGLVEGLADPGLAAVLLDLNLGSHHGLELLETIRNERPDLDLVVMTGHASVQTAVACMRRGASDYLTKPFDDVEALRTAVREAVRRHRERAREAPLHRPDADLDPSLVGRHPRMRTLARAIERLRQCRSRVLILGESGTGKGLVARAIHRGASASDPFVAVSCASLPVHRAEVELLGRPESGARSMPGALERARGGTLHLDGIEELPSASQALVLRALVESCTRDGTRASASPPRVISSSGPDLPEKVAEGLFRSDLYYQLDVVVVEVPPLRDRREDVPELARHFLAVHRPPRSRVEGFTPDAMDKLCEWTWPGNVRELENVIESGLALASGPLLDASDMRLLPAAPRRGPVSAPHGAIPLSLDAYERHALQRALDESGGDAARAARRLGIGRSTFYRKLAKHGLRSGPPVGDDDRSEAARTGATGRWARGVGVGGADPIG